MDDQRFGQIPALVGLGADVLERLLGHPRIVLERHALDSGAVVGAANKADEARHRAHVVPPAAQRIQLQAHVEIARLDADDGHLSPR